MTGVGQSGRKSGTRVSSNGRAQASQAWDAGSIPATRSTDESEGLRAKPEPLLLFLEKAVRPILAWGRRGEAVRQSPGKMKDAIAELLRQRVAWKATHPEFRQAAVLLPLSMSNAGLHLVLTKRTELVPTHKGQISFPGGGFEEGDGDLLATALREAQEEIGLRPEDVQIVGRLDDMVTVTSRHVVRPFVGIVPHRYPYRPDPFEIERLIHLPISGLLRGEPFREEIWEREGGPVSVFFYEHDGDTVWGLTARILKQFMETVGRPLREQGLLRCEGPSTESAA